MERDWTWSEIELEPGPGVGLEARRWLAFTFGLAGSAAIDGEVVLSEVVREAVREGRFDGHGLWLSADRPPGALHVEVTFPSQADFSVTDHDGVAGILEESTAAWGHHHEEGVTTVWFEITLPSSGWELELAEDADLVERMPVDDRAGDELVARYDPLIQRFASRYRRAGLEKDDLIQVGREALLGAVDRFEPSKGTFERFASRTIAGTLKKHLRDRGWAVRPPRGLQEMVLELRRTDRELTQSLGRAPTGEELSAATGRSLAEVERARAAEGAFDAGSLDEVVRPGGDTLGDRVAVIDGAMSRAPSWASVDTVLHRLPEREREIIRLRYFEDLTQREIADRVGLSQMHVSRLIRSSVAAMRREVGVSD